MLNPLCILGTAISLVIVAGLWGATNPFIKRGSKGIEKVKSSSAVGQFFAELWFLATNWKVCYLGLNERKPVFLAYILGFSKGHLIETVILSTHNNDNMCFVSEIRKVLKDSNLWLHAFPAKIVIFR